MLERLDWDLGLRDEEAEMGLLAGLAVAEAGKKELLARVRSTLPTGGAPAMLDSSDLPNEPELKPQDHAILALMGQGYDRPVIMRWLDLDRATVDYRRQRLARALGLEPSLSDPTTPQRLAVIRGIELGIVEPTPLALTGFTRRDERILQTIWGPFASDEARAAAAGLPSRIALVSSISRIAEKMGALGGVQNSVAPRDVVAAKARAIGFDVGRSKESYEEPPEELEDVD